MSIFDNFIVGRIVTKEGPPYFNRSAFIEEYGEEAGLALDVLRSDAEVRKRFDIGKVRGRLVELTGCAPEDIEDFLLKD